MIQSGCKIGLKGFGFIPLKDKNFKFPHIGKVLINDNVHSGRTLHTPYDRVRVVLY